jgi:hypothetical protein
MPKFFTTVKMNTLISMFHFLLHHSNCTCNTLNFHILWKYFSSWASIFVVWLKITSSWIRKFVDFVFVPKIKFVDFIFTTVKMNTLISMFHFLLHNYTADLSNVLKLSRIFAMQWNLYIMLKIYNPQILFWVQTQNPQIYESTNL